MGLFDKKYCGICGAEIGFGRNNKLRDGNCCNSCKGKLSPFHKLSSGDTLEAVKYELGCRENNLQRLKTFKPTKVYGEQIKILIDEAKYGFAVSAKKNFMSDKVDIIAFSEINNCEWNITEKRAEIKYKDSNGEINSFSPQAYAVSYDFFMIIDTKVPYINRIVVKLNSQPVNNGQVLLIDMEQSGVLNKLVDKLYKGKSYNGGKTSNIDEVTACARYRMFDAMVKEIKMILSRRPPQPQVLQKPAPPPAPAPVVKNEIIYVKCPYCDSKVESKISHCPYCNANLTSLR